MKAGDDSTPGLSKATVEADPITLAVIWNSLTAITEGAGTALRSMAFTPSIREGDDFSIAVFDVEGHMVAQGNFSPGHLGSMPFTVRAFLQERPAATWSEGDAVITNDPSVGAGHLSDVSMVVPVVWRGVVVAFVAATCHHIDVGGAAPGSQQVEGIVELYQEGLHIPPVVLYRAGVPTDVFRIFAANSRQGDKVISDLTAQRNALQFYAVQRMVELFDKFGGGTVQYCFSEILARTEEAVRREILSLPDGSYEYVNYVDDYGPGTPPIRIQVRVTIAGEEISVDFSGSDLQVPAGMNSYMSYTRAYVYCALRCLLRPDIPQNEGGLAPISVTAPEGSFFNPVFGAGCGARSVVCVRIAETIMGALGPVSERAVAAYGGWSHYSFGGIDPRSGQPVVGVDFFIAGHGARSNKDALDHWIGPANVTNIPVEIWEASYPLRVESIEVLRDSEGAGQFRGSPGLRKVTRFLLDDFTLSNLTEKQKYIPPGLAGGGAANAGVTNLIRDGQTTRLEGKGTYRNLKYGDTIAVDVSGGAGYGDPLDRDPEFVRRDLQERGIVSQLGAESRYGVLFDRTTGAVDYPATEGLRAARRRGESGS